MYFPQILDWFSSVDSAVVGELLQKWPTLDDLQRARAPKVAGFLSTHHIPDSRIAVLQQLVGQAVPAIQDRAVLDSSVLIVRRIVRQLELLRDAIAEHDKKIAALAESHPDYRIFSSLPAAGPAMVPRLIAAFGTQFGRKHRSKLLPNECRRDGRRRRGRRKKRPKPNTRCGGP